MNTWPQTLPCLTPNLLLLPILVLSTGVLKAQRGGFGTSVGSQIGRAADGNGDRTVTPAEWSAFVAGLPSDDKGGLDRTAIKAATRRATMNLRVPELASRSL